MNTAYPLSDEKGKYCWRNVSGKRIKIYQHLGLSGSMKESGKFPNKEIEKSLIEQDDYFIMTPEDLIQELEISPNEYEFGKKIDPYENNIQELASERLNFNQNIEILSKKDYNECDGTEIFRVINARYGKTSKDNLKNTIDGKIQYSENTNSTYGRGIYFSNNKENIISDYGKSDYSILNVKLKNTANIKTFANQSEFWSDVTKRLEVVPKEYHKVLTNEVSLLYMSAGIDGVSIKSNGYYVIYNRGELITYE